MRVPRTVVLATIMASSVYLALQGIGTIGRVSQLVAVLGLISLIVVILGAVPTMDLARLMPVFSRGASPIIRGSLMSGSLTILTLLLFPAIMSDVDGEMKRIRYASVGSILVSSVVLAIIAAAVTATFGAQLASDLTLPLYDLTNVSALRGVLSDLSLLS